MSEYRYPFGNVNSPPDPGRMVEQDQAVTTEFTDVLNPLKTDMFRVRYDSTIVALRVRILNQRKELRRLNRLMETLLLKDETHWRVRDAMCKERAALSSEFARYKDQQTRAWWKTFGVGVSFGAFWVLLLTLLGKAML